MPSVPASPPETAQPFQYAILRVVPHVERGEILNVGIILFCRPRRYLAARADLDVELLRAFAPGCDLEAVAAHLDLIPRICAGDPTAGPMARLSQPERFHWLVAPSSTMVQPSEVHTGLSSDPAATLEHLVRTLVERA
jgi:hypothetical protein